MKQFYPFILILLYPAILIHAQNAATPNAGFESWTDQGNFDTPDSGWNTLNPYTAVFSVFTCEKATVAGEFNSGAAGLKLITRNVSGQNANGIATTGTIGITPPYNVSGGIPFTAKPDTMVVWYKSSPMLNDAGFIQFMLLDSVGDTCGYAKHQAPLGAPVGAFTRIAIPITYSTGATPVTSQWILSSSVGSTGQQINATLWADDLDLTNDTIITYRAMELTGIKFGGNPVSTELIVINGKKTEATITFYNAIGQNFGEFQINQYINRVDLSGLGNGNYICAVRDLAGIHLLTARVVVSR